VVTEPARMVEGTARSGEARAVCWEVPREALKEAGGQRGEARAEVMVPETAEKVEAVGMVQEKVEELVAQTEEETGWTARVVKGAVETDLG